MTSYEDLSAEARVELDNAVRDAFLAEDGSTRTTTQAAEEFEAFVSTATQAGREYMHELLDTWRRNGIRSFVQTRWSAMQRVRMVDPTTGKTIPRPGNRGRKETSADGAVTWVKETLMLWTADDLRAGIEECLARINSERITIANYRALLALLDEHPSVQFVHEALSEAGVSLDEYLAATVGGA